MLVPFSSNQQRNHCHWFAGGLLRRTVKCVDEVSPAEMLVYSSKLAALYEAREQKTGRPMRLARVWRRVADFSAHGFTARALDDEAFAEVRLAIEDPTTSMWPELPDLFDSP